MKVMTYFIDIVFVLVSCIIAIPFAFVIFVMKLANSFANRKYKEMFNEIN